MLQFLKYKSIYLDRLAALYSLPHAMQVLTWLVEKATHKPIAYLLVHPSFFNQDHENQVVQWVSDLVDKQCPLQYILNTVNFLDIVLVVEPPVLIPRPETEFWVESVLKDLALYKNEPLKILDLCTGSGCIALSLASFFKNAQVDAVDLYQNPLELTSKNAHNNNCGNVTVIQSDLFTNLTGNQYDLIFTNPPYIDEQVWLTLDPQVKEWEDKNALVADNKGMALYEKIIPELPQFLKKESIVKEKPRFYTEIGYDQGLLISDLLRQTGFTHVHIHKDYAGHDRMVSAYY